MRTSRERSTAAKAVKPGWDCSVCQQRLEVEAGWNFRDAADIVHCEGSLVALDDRARSKFVPHHGYLLHPNCWRCHQPMGCDQCAGLWPVCRRCLVATTLEGFARNGPLTNGAGQRHRRGGSLAPPLHAYPPEFQRAWRQQLAADPPEIAAVYADYRTELATDPSGAEKRMGARLRATLAGIGRPMPAVTEAEIQSEQLRYELAQEREP